MDIQLKEVKKKPIPIYLMPGLAASSSIFERIDLDKELFKVHLLDWFLPEINETLIDYAKRMSEKIEDKQAVLIGVSFGGILVQEMKQFLNPKKVIIISSVKSNKEMPRRMLIAKTTKAYKILPTGLLENIEILAKFAFGDVVKSRITLYERYLKMNNKIYLNWAIEQVVCWERTKIDSEIVHIHGDDDGVFPSKNIKNFINVKNGTHMMILNRYKWLNQNLPEIILST